MIIHDTKSVHAQQKFKKTTYNGMSIQNNIDAIYTDKKLTFQYKLINKAFSCDRYLVCFIVSHPSSKRSQRVWQVHVAICVSWIKRFEFIICVISSYSKIYMHTIFCITIVWFLRYLVHFGYIKNQTAFLKRGMLIKYLLT